MKLKTQHFQTRITYTFLIYLYNLQQRHLPATLLFIATT